jgi:D-serine deaminase-like pyridoxal phosphate-dependent protein
MVSTPADRNRLWSRLTDALARHGEPLLTPIFVVDLDAFDANADDLVRRAGGKPIRVASKSLRVPALLDRALAHDGVRGVLAYTLRETLWLEEQRTCDDAVVAYPTVDRGALARLVASPSAAAQVTLMVDDVAHLDVMDSVRSSRAVPVRVALDVDAGLRLAGRHVGPKRSPLRDPADVVALARMVLGRPGFTFPGVTPAVTHPQPSTIRLRRRSSQSFRRFCARERAVSVVPVAGHVSTDRHLVVLLVDDALGATVRGVVVVLALDL